MEMYFKFMMSDKGWDQNYHMYFPSHSYWVIKTIILLTLIYSPVKPFYFFTSYSYNHFDFQLQPHYCLPSFLIHYVHSFIMDSFPVICDLYMFNLYSLMKGETAIITPFYPLSLLTHFTIKWQYSVSSLSLVQIVEVNIADNFLFEWFKLYGNIFPSTLIWYMLIALYDCAKEDFVESAVKQLKEGYINVGIPLEERCFRISLSVPYQLNPGVSWPIRGKWTLPVNRGGIGETNGAYQTDQSLKDGRTGKSESKSDFHFFFQLILIRVITADHLF